MARKGSVSPSSNSLSALDGETVTGKVKWFNDDKGYGFIERDDRGKDVFVHFSGIVEPEDGGRRTLEDGVAVEFIVVDSEKGPKAENVRLR